MLPECPHNCVLISSEPLEMPAKRDQVRDQSHGLTRTTHAWGQSTATSTGCRHKTRWTSAHSPCFLFLSKVFFLDFAVLLMVPGGEPAVAAHLPSPLLCKVGESPCAHRSFATSKSEWGAGGAGPTFQGEDERGWLHEEVAVTPTGHS